MVASLVVLANSTASAMPLERPSRGDGLSAIADLRLPVVDLLRQHFGADADAVSTLLHRAMLMPSGVLVSESVHKGLLLGVAMTGPLLPPETAVSSEPSAAFATRDAMEKYAIMACAIHPMAQMAPTIIGVPDELRDDAILFLVSAGMNASVRGIRRIHSLKSGSWIGVVVECEPHMVLVSPPRMRNMDSFASFVLARSERLWMHGLTTRALSRIRATSGLSQNELVITRARLLEARILASTGDFQAAGALTKQIMDSLSDDMLRDVTEQGIVTMCRILSAACQYSDAIDLASVGLALYPSSLELEALLDAILTSQKGRGVECP